MPRTVTPKEVAMRMTLEYSRGVKDHTTKSLEAICGLCWELEKQKIDIDAFALQCANLISKQFAIESVAIGVKDPADGRYRYKAVVGLDKDVADGFKLLSYSRAELLKESDYPSHDISHHTKLFLGEEHPYAAGEEFTYRRPGLIGMKRRALDDSLEADYLDFFFNGTDGDILGFIEISGTRLRKLPDSTTIRWIELIAGILGLAVQKARDKQRAVHGEARSAVAEPTQE